MTPDRWLVLIGGLLLVAFIVWFFWMNRAKGVKASETSSGHQEVMVLVKGGYTPDTIIVQHGKPVRLNFRREETASCSEKIIFAEFKKSADLPTGETVPVEFLPDKPGEYEFGCAMGMFRGKLIVEQELAMLTSAIETMVTWTILGLEFAALLAVILGFGWSLAHSISSGSKSVQHDGYESFRRDLGRSTLIALELLVAADILRSLVLELSLPNVSVLAALVAIRTFLSFSINVELYGCWPWERTKLKGAGKTT